MKSSPLSFVFTGNRLIIEKCGYDFLRNFAGVHLMIFIECGIDLIDLHQKEIIEPDTVRH